MSDEVREKTPQELDKMRKDLVLYYKEQSVVLEAQKKYECLQADIEDARQRRLLSTMRIAQMLAKDPDPEPETAKDPGPEKETSPTE